MLCYLALMQKFTQNPAIKLRPLSIGNKRFAEASPLNPVWGIGLWTDDPRAKDPHKWREKNLLGEALSAVREAIATARSDRPTRSPPVDSAAPPEMLESTKSRPLSSRAWGPGSALTKALLLPVFRVHPPIKARRFWR